MKIAVIGAGPAGISAAFFCKYFDKENEHDIYLFERLDKEKWLNYHSVCGGGVSKDLFEEIKPIKPNSILNKIKRIKEYYPQNIELTSYMDGYILDRPSFLRNIINEFEKLGGHFEIFNISKIKSEKDRVVLSTKSKTLNFDDVIAADGANSFVRKSLNVSSPITIPFTHYIVDKEPEDDKTLHFYLDESYEGNYKWVFPYKDKTKIGYPILKGKNVVPNFKDVKILETKSRGISFGGVDKLVKDRILLIGDAAGQTNAITKGGIRTGMVAGKLAAKAIINKNLETYEEEWKNLPYSSPLYLEGYRKLKEMDNEELVKHNKPLIGVDLNKKLDRLKVAMKTMFFYRKYLRLYEAYDLSEKWGW
jgi:digeranylgeranylglycerophospholipid reductase